MTIQDILSLSKAGFSREEILQLAGIGIGQPDPATETEAEPEPAPAPVPAPAPAPTPAPEVVPEQKEAGLDPAVVMEELLGIKKAIQSGNIQHSQMPTQLTPAEAADNVLANIISPKKEG